MTLNALLVCGVLAVVQASAPTMTIGAGTTYPGGTVAVPITLQTNGAAPASMAAWVHFDASRLQFLSVGQGAAATAAQKTLSGNVPESGIVHLVFWGVNLNAVGDGALGTISFKVLQATPLGNYTLTVTNDSMSDPDANSIAHTGVSGVIHVENPEVPDVAGMTQSNAQSVIVAAGMVLGTVTQNYSDTVSTGQIISQTPAAGSHIARGTAVNVVISKGPWPKVPNVVGLEQTAAATALANAGLAVGTVTQQPSNTFLAGVVINQSPPAGTPVDTGSAVALVASSGPPVNVPNVVGMTQAAASTALTTLGLAVGTVAQAYDATVPVDSVIGQDPPAGASVAASSSIALVISKGPEPKTVPNGVGITQAAASTAITDAGLTVGVVTEDYNDTIAAGYVISQDPAAATSVAPGTPVNLTVSKGPAVGTLLVNIAPAEVVAAGAQWSIDGGTTWHISGETVSGLPAATYVLHLKGVTPTGGGCFEPTVTWATPADQSVVVGVGSPTTKEIVYVPAAKTLAAGTSGNGDWMLLSSLVAALVVSGVRRRRPQTAAQFGALRCRRRRPVPERTPRTYCRERPS